ncbi:hypothetical protein KIW84_065174 [Lathyrus oleraceus]|uniref:Glycosyltransferase family 28 N-terminal domain-containing protein n=1 Tax=Pisum sativum TaxID=3888 RepID=A0A9D4WEP5_PEA|nr:hypothetical protein KIW84_065174 [Pisum sativum]
MGCNGIEHLCKQVLEEKKGFRQMNDDELVSVREEVMSQEVDDSVSSKMEEDSKANFGHQSSESEATSLPHIGLEHCITTTSGTERNLLMAEDEIMISRSMTEKRALRRHDLILDRLSEHEKEKLIANLVKIQKDGTVEVDLERSASVASELLELQSYEESTMSGSFIISDSKKSVPRLQIVILVVGTRGDVQPFVAIAKRLQACLSISFQFILIYMRKEYGHRVRIATHANFKTFVRSAGVNFHPLGGDPRVLAGYMARNKGLIPSGTTEISIQRKQLKAIIDSLLPACTAPDSETGIPFTAQAIIANPPAYGHVHVAEALGVPIHIFFTMPWTPTYAFPHPLARVPQGAGYWLSYIIVDLLIWWGMRGIINDFRKRTLKLPPIAYFSMYRGSISHLPTAYMWSPHLVPKPNDWGSLVDVVGYCFLRLGSKYQPREDFVQWIKKGPPPLYFGFGSMVCLLKILN